MKKDTKTVRMQDLLFAVLYGWKGILCTVLILAVALGGFFGIRDSLKLDPEEQRIAQDKYEDALFRYQNAYDTLTLNIRLQQEKVDRWSEYMEQSVLMQADYRNIYEARANLYINTDYKIDPQLTAQNPDYTESVVVQYVTALKGGMLNQEVAQKMDMDPVYVDELIQLTRYAPSTITVTVRHTEEAAARQILEHVLSYVSGLRDGISKMVCAHTLSTTQPAVALTVSSDVETFQQEQRAEMSKDLDLLMEKWDKREQLEEPLSGEMTVEKLITSILKGVIIGGILGGVLAVIWLAVAALLSDKVYSGDALEARMDLRVLGTLQEDKKPVEKWLRKLEGRTGTDPAFIGARAAVCCEGAVALCGSDEKMDSVSQLLSSHGVQILVSGDVLHDGTMLATLRKAAGAVLLVRCGKTTYSEISRMAELIRETDTPILAAIAID